jgi:hypothetical protein
LTIHTKTLNESSGIWWLNACLTGLRSVSGQNTGCAAEDNFDIARGGQRRDGRQSGQEAGTNGCGEGATGSQSDALPYHAALGVDVFMLFIQPTYVLLCVNASRRRWRQHNSRRRVVMRRTLYLRRAPRRKHPAVRCSLLRMGPKFWCAAAFLGVVRPTLMQPRLLSNYS